MTDSDSLPLLSAGDCTPVPVFNCPVLLRRSPDGRLIGRVASLPDIEVDGTTERDVLIRITRRFRCRIQDCLDRSISIPWIDPPQEPQPGEQQRFVPVHLDRRESPPP